MTLARRTFLGSVACAFAAAGVACKIPAWATTKLPPLGVLNAAYLAATNRWYIITDGGIFLYPDHVSASLDRIDWKV